MEQNMIRINPAKLAFGIKLLEELFSGQEVIEEMKRYTDMNGVLYIPNIENCYSNDFAHLRLEMDYSKADEKEFALDADNLVKNIYGIFSFCKNWKNDSGIFLLQETSNKTRKTKIKNFLINFFIFYLTIYFYCFHHSLNNGYKN